MKQRMCEKHPDRPAVKRTNKHAWCAECAEVSRTKEAIQTPVMRGTGKHIMKKKI